MHFIWYLRRFRMNCLQWYFVTFVAISCSSSLSLESADTANPLALTVIEESDVKTDASIALEVIEGSDDDPIEDEAINTILKACYNNGYYYPNTYYYPNNNYYRPTTNNNQLQNALAIGGLGLGAGVLGSLLIGAITPGNTVVGRSAIKGCKLHRVQLSSLKDYSKIFWPTFQHKKCLRELWTPANYQFLHFSRILSNKFSLAIPLILPIFLLSSQLLSTNCKLEPCLQCFKVISYNTFTFIQIFSF